MQKYRVFSDFLEAEYETTSEAESPQRAAAEHIAHLPFEDGLDYPDDFWSIVVPIAEGEIEIDLAGTQNEGEWSWPRGESLTWPMRVLVTAE